MSHSRVVRRGLAAASTLGVLVTLGAAAGDLTGAQTIIDGFWYGLAKRSIQV